jgi:hypothetical protein
MDLTEQLRRWGAVHGQARAAESAARQQHGADGTDDLHRRARALRADADRLHREIYGNLDGKGRAKPHDRPR